MNKEEFLATVPQGEAAEPNEDIQNEPTDTQEPEQAQEEAAPEVEDDAPQLNKAQQEAYDQGWRPRDEFKGDPDNWAGPKAFLKFKGFSASIDDLKADRSKQNGLHKLQIDKLKKELDKKVDTAVEEGDVEAFRAHQAEIDELNKQATQYEAPQSSTMDPEISEWNGRNPTVVSDPAKRAVAQSLYTDIEKRNPHMSVRDKLNILDNNLGAIYNETKPALPAQNPNRVAPSTHEARGRSKTPSRKRELTMGDMTRSEEDEYRKYGKTLYTDDKAWLQAVAAERKRNGA